jgi:hypothetical protein
MKKNLTFPMINIKSEEFRKISETVNNSPTEIPEETPKVNNSCSSLPKVTQATMDKIQLLDELGFASCIEMNKDYISENSTFKRRCSIGISDFWTHKSKAQFIREKGFQDAFQKMKIKVKLNEGKLKNSLRIPGLPHQMDSNLTRRSLIPDTPKLNSKTFRKSLPDLSCKSNQKFSEGLNQLAEKCRSFESESLKFKELSERILSIHKSKCEDKKLSRRITKQEKNLIYSRMCSLAS